ncbi:MAG: four helix bundle protein [Bacteroidales bacterium]|nr:four helix bundle protein [Bacteroidota bacterium]MBL6949764.1 four helix bundle protein [Bacteroidales bacterium]
MKLEELKVYQLSMDISEKIWNVVANWKYFEKDTIGKQLVRSADSISTNLSEGFGRYHYKDARNFYYYSRGSLFETKTWLKKALNRKFVEPDEYQRLAQSLNILGALINNYIKSIGSK